jgi:hypothetical protein
VWFVFPLEEESQSGHHRGTGTGGIALVVFQVQQIILDHLLGERIRRLLRVAGNSYHCCSVIPLGVFRKIPQFHCLDHLLPQWCHDLYLLCLGLT